MRNPSNHSSLTTRSALDRVLADLRRLASDSETLLELTAEDASAAAQEARSRLKAAISQAKETYDDLQARAIASVRGAAQEADAAIRARPYQSLGVAVGAGILIGLLASGRSSDE